MSLSKRARRGIAEFNRAKSPLYSAKCLVINPATTIQAYVDAFKTCKQKEASNEKT